MWNPTIASRNIVTEFSPFGDVELLWYNSPKPKKIKQTTILHSRARVIQRKTHVISTVDVPWSRLANLRLGYQFTKYRSEAIPTTHELVDPEEIGEATLRDVPYLPLLQEKFHFDEEDLSEHCYVCRQGGRVFIIPCLEIIRSLLIVNAYMALGLFQPTHWHLILDSLEVKETTVYLGFSTSGRQELLHGIYVRKICELLFLPSFQTAWGSVLQSFFDEERQEMRVRPLRCTLPSITFPFLVRTWSKGPVSFVLQIIDYDGKGRLPFTEVFCRKYTPRYNKPLFYRLNTEDAELIQLPNGTHLDHFSDEFKNFRVVKWD